MPEITRTMPNLTIGYIGKQCPPGLRKTWNSYLIQKNTNVFFDFYRTKDRRDLELRLSEMYLHGRAGYAVEKPFQAKVIPLLDRMAKPARKRKLVDTIVNERGVLIGYWVGGDDDQRKMAKQIELFLN